MPETRGITAVTNENSGSSRGYLFISTSRKTEDFTGVLRNMRNEKPVLNLNRKIERGFMTSLRPILA